MSREQNIKQKPIAQASCVDISPLSTCYAAAGHHIYVDYHTALRCAIQAHSPSMPDYGLPYYHKRSAHHTLPISGRLAQLVEFYARKQVTSRLIPVIMANFIILTLFQV